MRIHEDVIFLLQLHESFREVPFSKKYEILLVQVHYVMSYLSFYFSLLTVEPCAVFLAEQKDADDIDSGQLCLVLQEELASYKAKK